MMRRIPWIGRGALWTRIAIGTVLLVMIMAAAGVCARAGAHTTRGRFGRAIGPCETARVPANPAYGTTPLAVERLARLNSRTDIYVAPDGNDAWSGSRATPNREKTDGPVATPGRALAIARDRKAAGGPPQRVRLAGGRYYLSEPLVLGPQDSGLTIASRDKQPILMGGRTITGWEREGDRLWSAPVAGVREGTWRFPMLVVDGKPMDRARLPETGFFEHESVFDVPWMSTTGGGWKRKPTQQELTTLKYRDGDLGAWLDTRSAEVTVYHMWDESLVGVNALDAGTRTITFSSELGHPAGAFGVKRYVVWNVKEGLKRPGQWYLDRSRGRVVYWPLPDQDMSKVEVLAPVLESVVRVEGTEQAPARDITLRGLTILLANTPLKAGGFAAMAYSGAIQLYHAPGCRIQSTLVMNAAGQGIKADASPGLRIEHCIVHHTGACGLDITTPDSVVADTLVHDVGILSPSGAGILSNGARNAVEHCEVHDTPYSAIIGGGDGSRYEGNLIYHAMQQLHDGGGIYIGFSQGAMLRHNVIRDIVDTGGYGASAYYLDEQAHGFVVEDNLSVNVARPSQNHMAHDNTIRYNVFVVNGDASLDFARCKNYTLEGNVVWASGAITFRAPEGCLNAMGNNVLFSQVGRVELSMLTDYARGPAKPLTPRDGTVLEDPLFVDAAIGDCRFRRGSPALRLGLKQHDWSDVGPRNH